MYHILLIIYILCIDVSEAYFTKKINYLFSLIYSKAILNTCFKYSRVKSIFLIRKFHRGSCYFMLYIYTVYYENNAITEFAKI